MELLPGEITPLLQERLIETATLARSFEIAAQIFTSYTLLPASEATARRYAERAGAVMAAWADEVSPPAPLAAAATAESPPDARPYWVGADGAFVRVIGQGWREVRTVSIGRVQPPRIVNGEEEIHTTDLSYYSRLTDTAAEFIELVGGEFRRRGVGPGDRVAAGSDGADWCQDLFDHHCPDAQRCLDFYHASERVDEFSKALWGEETEAKQWYAHSHLHSLKHEGPHRWLTSLSVWCQSTAKPEVRKAASKQLGFFSTREPLLDYPGFLEAKLPIGTGSAESANVHVVQARMKGPGKFWGVQHVNPMLALRNARCSNRWEESWKTTSARLARERPPVSSVHHAKS